MSDRERLLQDLRAAWCEAFQLFEGASGEIYVSTPFLFGDGDALPLVIQPAGDQWRLTDQGQAISHLAMSDFEMTDRLEVIARRIANAAGLMPREDLVLEGPALEAPTVYDLADFLQAVAQVKALPLVRQRSARDAFVQGTQARVKRWVEPSHYIDGWSPPLDIDGLFATDARLTTEAGDEVYLWVAGDAERAERAANNIHQFERWGLQGTAVIGMRRDGLKDRTFDRVRAMVDPDTVVPMTTEQPQPLRQRLLDLAVPMAA